MGQRTFLKNTVLKCAWQHSDAGTWSGTITNLANSSVTDQRD
jgi:hypothetical protein